MNCSDVNAFTGLIQGTVLFVKHTALKYLGNCKAGVSALEHRSSKALGLGRGHGPLFLHVFQEISSLIGHGASHVCSLSLILKVPKGAAVLKTA